MGTDNGIRFELKIMAKFCLLSLEQWRVIDRTNWSAWFFVLDLIICKGLMIWVVKINAYVTWVRACMLEYDWAGAGMTPTLHQLRALGADISTLFVIQLRLPFFFSLSIWKVRSGRIVLLAIQVGAMCGDMNHSSHGLAINGKYPTKNVKKSVILIHQYLTNIPLNMEPPSIFWTGIEAKPNWWDKTLSLMMTTHPPRYLVTSAVQL